jgi:hypothetical protein
MRQIMTYQIFGLAPAAFADSAALIARGAVRVVADAPHGFPCRVTLEDAEPGESLLLVNHVSADVGTPFRASHAIFVREGAQQAAHYRDAVPPLIERRTTSLRAFDRVGMIRTAALVPPGAAHAHLREMLANEAIDHVDIHAAAWGCFLARAERCDA